MKNATIENPTYTECLKAHISESDFGRLVEKASGYPSALENLSTASAGGNSIRSMLATAAQICGSDFRPENWM